MDVISRTFCADVGRTSRLRWNPETQLGVMFRFAICTLSLSCKGSQTANSESGKAAVCIVG